MVHLVQVQAIRESDGLPVEGAASQKLRRLAMALGGATPQEVSESGSEVLVTKNLLWCALMKFARVEFADRGFLPVEGDAYAVRVQPDEGEIHKINPEKPWEWTPHGTNIVAIFRVKQDENQGGYLVFSRDI